jgi:hypothetical protein
LNAGLAQGQQIALSNAYTGAGGNAGQIASLGALVNGQNNVQATASPYAGQNKYLDSVVNNSNSDITKSYMQGAGIQLPTQFAQGGAFGGSAMQ